VAESFVRAAGQNDATMVFLPEAFDFIGVNVEETIALSETLEGPLITRFKELAVEYSIWISLGGFHERTVSQVERMIIILKLKLCATFCGARPISGYTCLCYNRHIDTNFMQICQSVQMLWKTL
jgi:predicted amidohydrolase